MDGTGIGEADVTIHAFLSSPLKSGRDLMTLGLACVWRGKQDSAVAIFSFQLQTQRRVNPSWNMSGAELANKTSNWQRAWLASACRPVLFRGGLG
jgi:hypothetical protein